MYTFRKWYIQECFDKALREIGYPPLVLAPKKVFGYKAKLTEGYHLDGLSNYSMRSIWINKNQENDIALKGTIWHEILHCIFYGFPEWWVEIASYKLARRKKKRFGWEDGDDYGKSLLGKTLDYVPERKELISTMRHIVYDMNNAQNRSISID